MSERDARLDSATGLLLILVVLGHMLATMHGAAAHAAVLWIYMFHMPAFVFVSGYVTRYASTWSPLNIASRLLFPYIVFATLQRVLDAWWNGTPVDTSLGTVPWTLWYLLALFAWRLCVPLVRNASFWLAVPIAVTLSVLGAGVPWIGPDFALGRIVALFPFFAAGLLWRPEWWKWALSLPTRVASASALAAAAAVAIVRHDDIARRAFFFSLNHRQLGISATEAMIDRATLLALCAPLALAAVILGMRALPVLPSIAIASLPVYLLHPLVLFAWHEDGAPEWFAGTWAVAVAVGLSAGLAWLLSRGPVVAAARPVMDLSWWRTTLARRTARMGQ